jgi:hypothetical protein
MFGSFFLVMLVYFILAFIFGLIGGATEAIGLTLFLMFVLYLIFIFVYIGLIASLYKQLAENV